MIALGKIPDFFLGKNPEMDYHSIGDNNLTYASLKHRRRQERNSCNHQRATKRSCRFSMQWSSVDWFPDFFFVGKLTTRQEEGA